MNTKMWKDLVKTTLFHAEMKSVFFEAMRAGYASNAKKGTITELPGSKLIPPYVHGPWKVTDVYHVTQLSSMSGGTTIVSYEGIPVWMMQYFGQYYEEAIPCLKAALRNCYSRNEFRGGRGPARFTHGKYVYENPKTFPQDFKLFRGDELISDENGKVFGRHVYQGGIMC